MSFAEYLAPILIGIWLLLCSYQDIRRKKINLLLILAGFIIIIVNSVFLRELTILNRMAGTIPGIILLALSYITRGQIGIGDGLIVIITGIGLGITQNTILLAYGLSGSAIFSIILLTLRLANRKKTIPFVPFIFMGYLGVHFFA
jgi:leader peptidase (prepilin peptidase)/N-methyltransferase